MKHSGFYMETKRKKPSMTASQNIYILISSMDCIKKVIICWLNYDLFGVWQSEKTSYFRGSRKKKILFLKWCNEQFTYDEEICSTLLRKPRLNCETKISPHPYQHVMGQGKTWHRLWGRPIFNKGWLWIIV